jgi:trehalose/maltose hydrolase-like predicted phosphorylase
MAGTADILQRAYTGLETREDILWFNPVLPEGLGRLHMHIRYRNHSLEMDVVPGKLTIEALPCAAGPIRIGFKSEVFELKMGETKEFGLA